MSEAAKLLLEFIKYAAPMLPEIKALACSFWQCRVVDLGPVPRDLKADFAAVDADIDRQIAEREAKAKGGTK
jgi:hypothetical protein